MNDIKGKVFLALYATALNQASSDWLYCSAGVGNMATMIHKVNLSSVMAQGFFPAKRAGRDSHRGECSLRSGVL